MSWKNVYLWYVWLYIHWICANFLLLGFFQILFPILQKSNIFFLFHHGFRFFHSPLIFKIVSRLHASVAWVKTDTIQKCMVTRHCLAHLAMKVNADYQCLMGYKECFHCRLQWHYHEGDHQQQFLSLPQQTSCALVGSPCMILACLWDTQVPLNT